MHCGQCHRTQIFMGTGRDTDELVRKVRLNYEYLPRSTSSRCHRSMHKDVVFDLRILEPDTMGARKLIELRASK
jgi:hypothetical protein